MPILANAKKALRKSKRRYLFNRRVKDRIKRWKKKVDALIKENNKSKAVKSFSFLTKLLDKAAKRNIYHKNKVNRIKSNIQKKINAL